jgi:hypothetical protein
MFLVEHNITVIVVVGCLYRWLPQSPGPFFLPDTLHNRHIVGFGAAGRLPLQQLQAW